jgi:hypothetical protein
VRRKGGNLALTPKAKNYLIRRGMQAITPRERKLVEFYELLWYGRHHVPTIEQAANHLNIPQSEVNYYLTRKCVTKALESRGIPWAQHSQTELTATQVAAAITVMNFADSRSIADKLDEMGVNTNQYYAWLLDPQFKNLVDTLADSNIKNIRPTAVAEFTKLVNKGDWHAIKYYLEVTGELKSDTPRSEHLIRLIIEIIQKHVKDPEIIVAIAQDIKLASANRTLEVVAEAASPASVIDVVEERKQLGV